MSSWLRILSCANFHQEIEQALAAEGFEGVSLGVFPARCGRPPLSWDELRPLLGDGERALVLGGICLQRLAEPPAGMVPVDLHRMGQCFHLCADGRLVDRLTEQGGYLISPGWLAHWRERLREWGFVPESAGDFFHDFAKRLVLLDTGSEPDSATPLAQLAAAVGLPAETIPVGDDHVRLYLARLVLQQQLAERQRQYLRLAAEQARERADQAATLDLVSQLASAVREEEAIAQIETIFRMLFAPGLFYFIAFDERGAARLDGVPAVVRDELSSLEADHAWTRSGNGLLLRIRHGGKRLGALFADQLAFPAYRDRYLSLALALAGICGLAMENARTYQRIRQADEELRQANQELAATLDELRSTQAQLLEAKKMAALGTLVAGVAHEVNTPVGVGLTATSALQRRHQQITQAFQGRTMQYGDLQDYLRTSAQGLELILANLRRIGELVDGFRQVAVEQQPERAQPLLLRACLREALDSLGSRLEGCDVRLSVDESLRLRSYRLAWSQILINLVNNSLQHGFRDRDPGHIVISAWVEGDRLLFEYRDDGAGIAQDVLPRIFDPFFTTDLQHGMGLGLHIVFNLVHHRLGGEIQCQSQPGRGVRFLVQLKTED